MGLACSGMLSQSIIPNGTANHWRRRLVIATDVETGSKVTEFADHPQDVMSISINPTNQHVFMSGACDAFAKIWDIRTGKAVQTFAGHESDINGVLHDWDVETGSKVSG